MQPTYTVDIPAAKRTTTESQSQVVRAVTTTNGRSWCCIRRHPVQYLNSFLLLASTSLGTLGYFLASGAVKIIMPVGAGFIDLVVLSNCYVVNRLVPVRQLQDSIDREKSTANVLDGESDQMEVLVKQQRMALETLNNTITVATNTNAAENAVIQREMTTLVPIASDITKEAQLLRTTSNLNLDSTSHLVSSLKKELEERKTQNIKLNEQITTLKQQLSKLELLLKEASGTSDEFKINISRLEEFDNGIESLNDRLLQKTPFLIDSVGKILERQGAIKRELETKTKIEKEQLEEIKELKEKVTGLTQACQALTQAIENDTENEES